MSWESGAIFPQEAVFCSSSSIDERLELNIGHVNSESQ